MCHKYKYGLVVGVNSKDEQTVKEKSHALTCRKESLLLLSHEHRPRAYASKKSMPASEQTNIEIWNSTNFELSFF